MNIDPRYLTNIENSGDHPSVPVLYELVKICKRPVEHYFHPEAGPEGREQGQRACHKLKLCPEQYLPMIEGAIDGAIKIEETEGEKPPSFHARRGTETGIRERRACPL